MAVSGATAAEEAGRPGQKQATHVVPDLVLELAVFGNPVQVLLALVLGSGSKRSRYAMLPGARRAINRSVSQPGVAQGYVFISRCLAGRDRGD